MRRNEREITDRATVDAVIRSCQVCRLALIDDDTPYIVPLCFGYDAQCLYFHGATAGRKMDVFRRNRRVGFEFDVVEGLVPASEACGWSIRYRSVIGAGTLRIATDSDEKRRGLAAIMAQYGSNDVAFADCDLDRTAVLVLQIETITGKQSPRPV